jgi:hypothetical protein
MRAFFRKAGSSRWRILGICGFMARVYRF